MTTASIRTGGIDRLMVRFGLALVKWGRVRASRAATSNDRQAALLANEHVIAERERAAHRYGIAA